MEESDDIFKQIGIFIVNNPVCYGILIIVLGILLLLSAIYDVNFIFRENASYNMQKIEGWVNIFGRKTARFMVGSMSIVLMIIGMLTIYILF